MRSATPIDAMQANAEDAARPPRRRQRWQAGVVTAAALAGIALTARLGFWQLDRAHQKVALQASIDARADAPALDASSLARTAELAAEQHFRPVVLRGHWLADRTVYLDNRQMDGKVGFYVLTPLSLAPLPGAVVVQRGWAPRNFAERAVLPRVETPAGTVTVEGTVAPPPSRLLDLGAATTGPIRQNLDLAAFARESGLDLLPLSVVQRDASGAPADGLLRHWPRPDVDVQKHYGYAVQWFAMAAGIVILYVWHRFIRPRQP